MTIEPLLPHTCVDQKRSNIFAGARTACAHRCVREVWVRVASHVIGGKSEGVWTCRRGGCGEGTSVSFAGEAEERLPCFCAKLNYSGGRPRKGVFTTVVWGPPTSKKMQNK